MGTACTHITLAKGEHVSAAGTGISEHQCYFITCLQGLGFYRESFISFPKLIRAGDRHIIKHSRYFTVYAKQDLILEIKEQPSDS
ncbi:hypothetical protein C2869_01075 [Saccharobesus litoralis]|uniref:Uncharacterized protein n=1 Tax=Saccharobesus litoralis TaxID=2172099 RepID=A0A2S0VLN5_9ALTE|nr:hypothetical protein [Saccharobesus litoralis]AWB65118.1 hypothetical protein C2869_01075 [Saccharobesus litoralis]